MEKITFLLIMPLNLIVNTILGDIVIVDVDPSFSNFPRFLLESYINSFREVIEKLF